MTTEVANSLRETLVEALKSIANLSAVLFVAGLFVFHSYLGRIGIADFKIITGRYLALGVVFAVFVAGPALLAIAPALAVTRARPFWQKALLATGSFVGVSLCIGALWQVVIHPRILPSGRPFYPLAIVPYTEAIDDTAAPLSATATITLLVTFVYAPTFILWRARQMPVAKGTRSLPALAAVLLFGIIVAAQLFVQTVPKIPAAFGGGYYGTFIFRFTTAATAALHSTTGDQLEPPSEDYLNSPIRLVHMDSDAVYIEQGERGLVVADRVGTACRSLVSPITRLF